MLSACRSWSRAFEVPPYRFGRRLEPLRLERLLRERPRLFPLFSEELERFSSPFWPLIEQGRRRGSMNTRFHSDSVSSDSREGGISRLPAVQASCNHCLAIALGNRFTRPCMNFAHQRVFHHAAISTPPSSSPHTVTDKRRSAIAVPRGRPSRCWPCQMNSISRKWGDALVLTLFTVHISSIKRWRSMRCSVGPSNEKSQGSNQEEENVHAQAKNVGET